MFGNRLGWCISAVLIAITGLLLYWLWFVANDFTRPSAIGLNADKYTLELPINPRTLATWMTEQEDAVGLYQQAIDEFNKDPIYARNDFQLYKDEIPKLQKGLDLLVKASTKAKGGVLAKNMDKVISYDIDRPPLRAIYAMGNVASKVAIVSNNKEQYPNTYDPARAKKLFQAVFSLGIKLYEERLVLDEFQNGRQLLAASRYLDDPPGKEGLKQQFDSQWIPFYDANVFPVQRRIWIANPDAKRFPQFKSWGGDMAAIATKSKEEMWQVEGIFAVGRLKYNGNTRGDQKAARRLLTKLCQSDDSRIRIAATAANALTVEDFHRLTYTRE